ncbi:MAG TPA: hypothetical protein VGS28_02815 [Candidatus Saccharimonadales bacterium]|nr:hypothetical protein [Candidatus Saccharimonadales bacterium]
MKNTKKRKLPSVSKRAKTNLGRYKLITAVVSVLVVAFIGAHVYLSSSSADNSPYPDPNGTHWHCQEYKSLYSWDCISGFGFLYGGMWAFVSDFYQHPHPSSDYVVNEAYFNQNGPNGMTKTAQWRHRLIAVNDGAVQGLVEPFDWRISAGDNNPPAPTTCLVLTGDQQGQQIPCTPLVQTSILDYWHQANVIPSQVAW